MSKKLVLVGALMCLLISMTSIPVVASTEIEVKEDIEVEPWWELPQISAIAKEPVEEPVVEEAPIDLEFEIFVQATFVHETGNGKHPKWKSNNNPGGIKCWSSNKDSDGYCIYNSPEEGMQALRDLLYEPYYVRYNADYKAIREVYCQCGSEDYQKFMQIMKEVRRNYEN